MRNVSSFFRRPWDSQPQEAVGLDTNSPLAEGLFVSIENGVQIVGGAPSSASSTGASLAPLAASASGIAFNTAGGTFDRRVLVNGPLNAADKWTFATTLHPFANVSLAHVFGFGLTYAGTVLSGATGAGEYRALLCYSNNYYFWGNSADWNTGIAFDTDGAAHTAMFVHDGTNIYFYRDGVLKAQTARPAAMVATTAGRYAVIGNRHASGTNSPNAHIVNGRAWSRAFTPSEAAEYPRKQWQLFEPHPIPVYVAGAGGGVTGTLTATESGGDTAALTGAVAVVGAVAATEAGSDAAAIAGTVTVAGALAAAESGSDSAEIVGAGALSTVTGSLAADESGADSASIAGDVYVTGALAATEAGSDTAAITNVAAAGFVKYFDVLSGNLLILRAL